MHSILAAWPLLTDEPREMPFASCIAVGYVALLACQMAHKRAHALSSGILETIHGIFKKSASNQRLSVTLNVSQDHAVLHISSGTHVPTRALSQPSRHIKSGPWQPRAAIDHGMAPRSYDLNSRPVQKAKKATQAQASHKHGGQPKTTL